MLLNCRYAERVMLPHNAIGAGVSEYETADGVNVRLKFIGTWNNKDGLFDEELNKICDDAFGVAFDSIKSIWIARLGMVDDYWHLVKLIKL